MYQLRNVSQALCNFLLSKDMILYMKLFFLKPFLNLSKVWRALMSRTQWEMIQASHPL